MSTATFTVPRLDTRPTRRPCGECGAVHARHLPHAKGSMLYQVTFHREHGRWPTHMDALSHCSETVRSRWIEANQDLIAAEAEAAEPTNL